MVNSLQLLRGQVYESWDKEAVRTDLTCVEAMTSLTPQQLRGKYIQEGSEEASRGC